MYLPPSLQAKSTQRFRKNCLYLFEKQKQCPENLPIWMFSIIVCAQSLIRLLLSPVWLIMASYSVFSCSITPSDTWHTLRDDFLPFALIFLQFHRRTQIEFPRYIITQMSSRGSKTPRRLKKVSNLGNHMGGPGVRVEPSDVFSVKTSLGQFKAA